MEEVWWVGGRGPGYLKEECEFVTVGHKQEPLHIHKQSTIDC